MITFIPRHPAATLAHTGYFPTFLDDRDPRPAREQIDDRYRFGGGRHPNGTVHQRMNVDPTFAPICELRMGDERIVMYQYSVFAIIQPDGSFEVARCD